MKRFRRTATVTVSAMLLGAVATGPAFADTLFGDTFDDGDANGWTRSGGSWAVVTDGSPAYRQSSTGANARALAGSTSWTDYTVRARVRPIAFGAANRSVGVAARARSASEFYGLVLTGSGTAQLHRVTGGTVAVLGTAVVGGTAGTWRTLALSVHGSTLAGYVDGAPVVRATDTVAKRNAPMKSTATQSSSVLTRGAATGSRGGSGSRRASPPAARRGSRRCARSTPRRRRRRSGR